MPEAKHFCIDRILPEDHQILSEPSVPFAQRLALLTGKTWKTGQQIDVWLINPSSQQAAEFQEAAEEWMRYANVDIRVTNQRSAIVRVTFDPTQGAWSLLGTDATRVGRQPTMNLGFNSPGTYLHEIGHMLGAIHEHQNPQGGIEWDREAVIRDLIGPPNYWDGRTIHRNMFHKYDEDLTNGSKVDPHSIMLYAIPDHWTLDGFSSEPNVRLSDLDKQWIRQQYPKEMIDLDAEPKPEPVRPIGLPTAFTMEFADGQKQRFEAT